MKKLTALLLALVLALGLTACTRNDTKKLAGTWTYRADITERINQRVKEALELEQVSPDAATSASAMVKIAVNGQSEMSAAEGLGPVDALDKAMRRALTVFYPSIAQMRLTDFKVRVLDSSMATASQVRVLVESTDGVSFWSTTGVSTDIIKASTTALVDSMVYKLYRDDKAAGR